MIRTFFVCILCVLYCGCSGIEVLTEEEKEIQSHVNQWTDDELRMAVRDDSMLNDAIQQFHNSPEETGPDVSEGERGQVLNLVKKFAEKEARKRGIK